MPAKRPSQSPDYTFRMLYGICRFCGKEYAVEGKQGCAACNKKQAAHALKKPTTMTEERKRGEFVEFIEPSVERIEAPDNLHLIEIAGRTCYKSEDRITEDSAAAFCQMLIKRGHHAMLEHSSIVIDTSRAEDPADLVETLERLRAVDRNGRSYIVRSGKYYGGNVRAWRELFKGFRYWFSGDPLFADVKPHDPIDLASCRVDAAGLPEDDRWVLDRQTVRVICDRAISHELVRHRVMSFAQESTRYVDYNGGKVQIIKPYWLKGSEQVSLMTFRRYAGIAVGVYKRFREYGLAPQAARCILPNCLKTELVITGTRADWDTVLSLRCAKDAHPDAQKIGKLIRAALDAPTK